MFCTIRSISNGYIIQIQSEFSNNEYFFKHWEELELVMKPLFAKNKQNSCNFSQGVVNSDEE